MGKYANSCSILSVSFTLFFGKLLVKQMKAEYIFV